MLYSMFPSVVYFMHSINNVYVLIPVSQFLPPHPSPPWYPYSCSPRLCLYFCSSDKIICTIFLDSTYMHYYMIFAFLFLTYFTLYDIPSRSIMSLQMTQFHSFLWLIFKTIHAPQCSQQHYLQSPGHGSNLNVHQQRNG